MIKTYLSPDEYTGSIPHDKLKNCLRKACRAVDCFTFNRIVKAGFENLTEFQQELIKEAVRLHAEFTYNNAELLDSPLSSYNISGISMSFDRSKIVTVNGIITTSEVYGLLMQTGLCFRGLDL